mmetsp:Transcript_11089/g.33242  ORF Transcript_11089/g.33242 Transcript_11089/m.33242 type:complete len:217 (+) Transcript_11089:929-1579(+)
MTAALSSNRIVIPLLRRIPLHVLTITALTISDFFKGIFGTASLTTAIIISPILADWFCFPKTRIHINFRAPLLSATLRKDSGCIIISFFFSLFFYFIRNCVVIGILYAASLIAARAVDSEIPLSSYKIRPGFTTATQYSGDPFPDPIRVSAGRIVTGLSGNTRIQSFPPRRAYRVIARRPDSICLEVIQHGSNACKAKSPNAILFALVEIPPIFPR